MLRSAAGVRQCFPLSVRLASLLTADPLLWYIAGAANRHAASITNIKRAASSRTDNHRHNARSARPPPPPLCDAVMPFQVSPGQAAERFTKWIRAQVLAPSHVRKVAASGVPNSVLAQHRTKVFLPFYVFDAQCECTFTGDIGYLEESSQVGRVYFLSTRRPGELRWRFRRNARVSGELSTLSADEPEMQVFASYRFKRALVQIVKTPLHQGQCVEWADLQAADVRGANVEPFVMSHKAAKDRVVAFLHEYHARRAATVLLRKFGGDEVFNTHVEVRIRLFARRVFLPAYYFDFEGVLGRAFRAFVSGTTGALEGAKQYSFSKTTASAAAALTVGAAFNMSLFPGRGPSMGLITLLERPLLWIEIVAIPSLLFGVYMVFHPVVRQWARERARLAEEAAMGDAEHRMDYEEDEQSARRVRNSSRFWEKAKAKYNAGYRESRDWQQQQQQWRSSPRRGTAASKLRATVAIEKYRILGVQRDASLSDISTAFRKLALQEHPDMVAESQKTAANEKFRKIVEAYKTLRDPKKRAEYDASNEP